MQRFSLAVTLAASLLATACDKGPTKSSTAEPTPAMASATPPGTAPAPTAPAVAKSVVSGQSFGAGVTLVETASIDAILADPSAFKGKTVRVEGMVLDVCPKRGCWMELAGKEPGHKLKFKVADGDMVFPADSKGKTAVAQGAIAVNELSIEDSKAQAEYEAKEYGKPFDPASITKPMLVVRLDGTGAVFRDVN
ncbi:MAG: DUF4920 domain-containing protein [Polyangiales bacterium]